MSPPNLHSPRPASAREFLPGGPRRQRESANVLSGLLRCLASVACILLLGGLCAGLVGCKEATPAPVKVVAKADLELKPLKGRWYLGEVPFDGRAERYADDGQVLESVTYVKGKKHGEAVSYHPNGEVRRRATYVRNRLDGEVKIWSPTGMLREETYYEKGVRNGVQRTWHPNGQLAKERNLVNGKEEGMQRAWLRNGKIYVNYEYRNGRRFGLKRSTLCYELEDEVVQF